MDYKNGKIYAIESLTSGKRYYGSTTQPLSKRFYIHKNHYKQYLKCKEHYRTSFEIMKEQDAVITLVESFPCENRNQLEARERYYIRNNECVNKVQPTRTSAEYNNDYKLSHVEEIKMLNKKYREKNKDTIREYKRQYREINRDKIKEKSYQNIKCNICDCEFRIGSKSIHERSKKHIENMNKQNT